MLIACAMIAPMAISLLREGGRELLEAAPSRALSAQIAMADAAAGLPPWTIGEEDAVRRAITTRLDALGHEVWATVELTTDPGLAAA